MQSQGKCSQQAQLLVSDILTWYIKHSLCCIKQEGLLQGLLQYSRDGMGARAVIWSPFGYMMHSHNSGPRHLWRTWEFFVAQLAREELDLATHLPAGRSQWAATRQPLGVAMVSGDHVGKGTGHKVPMITCLGLAACKKKQGTAGFWQPQTLLWPNDIFTSTTSHVIYFAHRAAGCGSAEAWPKQPPRPEREA